MNELQKVLFHIGPVERMCLFSFGAGQSPALPCPALPGSEVKLTGPRARTPLIAFIPGDWTVNGAAHTSTDC